MFTVDVFDRLSHLSDPSFFIKIFCGEDHLVWKGMRRLDTAFQEHMSYRPTDTCYGSIETFAWMTNGYGADVKEAHVVLCPVYLEGKARTTIDDRDADQILNQGLVYDHLDSIVPLSSLLLHEVSPHLSKLLHTH